MFLKESFLCFFLIIADTSAQNCCPTKKVAGNQDSQSDSKLKSRYIIMDYLVLYGCRCVPFLCFLCAWGLIFSFLVKCCENVSCSSVETLLPLKEFSRGGLDQLLNITCAFIVKSENYEFYLLWGSLAADCGRCILIGGFGLWEESGVWYKLKLTHCVLFLPWIDNKCLPLITSPILQCNAFNANTCANLGERKNNK